MATGASHEGRTLIADGMKAALISEIRARQGGAAAAPVEAVVKAIDPKLTTEQAKAFAPKMKVISSYSVYYFVIVNNHFGGNIEGPATVLNGTVVPPGGKFDFWKEVGNLRNAPGVGPGNAIEGGKISPRVRRIPQLHDAQPARPVGARPKEPIVHQRDPRLRCHCPIVVAAVTMSSRIET